MKDYYNAFEEFSNRAEFTNSDLIEFISQRLLKEFKCEGNKILENKLNKVVTQLFKLSKLSTNELGTVLELREWLNNIIL